MAIGKSSKKKQKKIAEGKSAKKRPPAAKTALPAPKSRLGAAKGGRRASPARTPSAAILSMTKRKEKLKDILLRKRNEVVQELEQQLGRKLSLGPDQRLDSVMDSADQSAFDMNEGIDYALIEMKYRQYKDIADSFRKLQNGTYGLCEECGGEIDIRRLEVNPLARYCIACKTRKEELEKIQKEETRFKE